jgi:phage-related protein
LSSPWADARVEASLDYGNIDEELQQRLVRSTEIASKACQKHFRAIERAARTSATNTGQNWERAALRVSRAMETAETRGGKALAALALHGQKAAAKLRDSFDDAFDRILAKATSVLASVRAELRSLPNATVKLTVEFSKTQAEVAARAIHTHLRNFVRLVLGPIEFGVSLNDTAARARLTELTRTRTVRINTVTGSDRGSSGGGDVDRIGRSGRALSGITSMLGSIASGAGTAAKYLGIAGSAVVALGAATPAVAALAAVLASVGVAAGGAAIAGVSALALAVGTLKVGMSGVGDAFTALGAEATGGGGAAVDVAKQMADAQRTLTRAVRDEKDAQKDVSDARKDALERLEDYNLEAKGAALSEKDAVLSLKEAREDLAKGGFDNGTERERAALRVEQAEQRLAETRESNGDLESEIADARKKGVNGADEVVDANRRLEDATYAVRDAQYALNQVGKDSGSGIDKAAEALAKLSPHARDFVLAIRGVKPAWDEMKSGVQDSLFAGLADRIQPLANTYLPILGAAMTTVADGFNEGAISALNFAQSGTGISVMSTLLGESANMAGNLGSTLGNLVPGLAAIAAGAGQAFSPLTDGMAGVVRGWSDRMVELQQNGGMQAFFEKAMDVASQFGAVLSDIGGIISGVFNAANSAGSGLMGTLGQVLDQVNTFVNSVQGQEALTTFFSSMMTAVGAVLPVFMELASIVGTVVAPVIAQLATTLGPVLMQVASALGDRLRALAPAFGPVGDAIAAIGTALVPILPILGRLIGSFLELAGPIIGSLATALGPILEVIGNGLIAAFEALQPAIGPVTDVLMILSEVLSEYFTQYASVLVEIINGLVPVITTLATGFGELLTALLPVLPILGDALIQIITAVAPMIQEMAGVWLEVVQAILPLLPPLIQIVANLLPPLIELITALLPVTMMAAQVFAQLIVAIAPILTVLAQVIAKFSEVIAAVVSFSAQVIGTVVDFVGKVVGFFGGLVTQVTDKVGGVKDAVVTGFNGIVEFFRGLPETIKSFAGNIFSPIFDAAKAVFNGIADLWNNTAGKLSFKAPKWVPGIGGKGFDMPDIPKMRTGGLARGPGGPTGDKILSWLSNREFVTRAKVVAQRGALPFLQAFNSGRITMDDIRRGLPGFAAGGLAGREPYGLPAGSSGSDVFPQWVYDVASQFNLTPSTYAGHQERDGQNKGIDWSGSVPDMQRFAEHLAGISGELEQVIWMNPETGQQIGVADGQMVGPGTDQPGYYRDDWAGHQDHVHTRQSYAFGGAASDPNSPVEDPTGGSSASALTASSSSTPIGSGIGSGTTGGSASWGNSGGSSKFNTAADAKANGITPVWVENWPSTMGGGSSDSGSYTSSDTGGALTADTGAPASTTDTIALVQNPDGTYSAVDPEWDKLIKRESGGRADIVQGVQDANSGGNEASGLFQIAKGTWASNGGTNFAPTAGEATAEQQAEIAAKIFNAQGGSPWGSGAGQNLGRENEELLRAGVQRAGSVPVTPEGTVPVTITGAELPANSDPNAAPQLDYTPTTTTNSASMPDPSTATTPTSPSSTDMPFGPDRANTWLGEQDFAAQAGTWATDASKEILGQFAEPFGLSGYVDKGIDQVVEYLRQMLEQQRNQAPGEVKFADSVIFNGMDPQKTKQEAMSGMTQVTETFRSG